MKGRPSRFLPRRRVGVRHHTFLIRVSPATRRVLEQLQARTPAATFDELIHQAISRALPRRRPAK